MVYYIAYIADGPNHVEFTKFNNKDEVIEFLILGHNSENWTGLCRTLKECKKEAAELLKASWWTY